MIARNTGRIRNGAQGIDVYTFTKIIEWDEIKSCCEVNRTTDTRIFSRTRDRLIT